MENLSLLIDASVAMLILLSALVLFPMPIDSNEIHADILLTKHKASDILRILLENSYNELFFESELNKIFGKGNFEVFFENKKVGKLIARERIVVKEIEYFNNGWKKAKIILNS